MNAFFRPLLLPALVLALGSLSAAQASTAVTLGTLPLHRTASLQGRVVGSVPSNTLLTVACQGQWCRTSYAGRGGYVRAAALRRVSGSAHLVGKGDVYFRSCEKMRALRVGPVRVGKPGYRTGLDSNHNDWACDKGDR